MLMTKKLRAATMTEAAITKKVFRGARVNQFRGLTDAFSEKEIHAIASNPNAGDWRNIAQDLLVAPHEETDDERNWRD